MKARITLILALILSLAACAGLLGIRREPSHPFEHRAHVIKGMNCTECHAGIASATDEGPVHFPETADCLRCHEKPHNTQRCDGCHGESHVRGNAELARQTLRFRHDKHMPAVHGDCVRCHVEVAQSRPEALRPVMATCFGCHEHRDQWQVRDCNGCHVDIAAETTPPASHVVHDGDWLREHGVRAASARDLCSSCHSERSCAACHGVGTVPGLPARLRFDDINLAGQHRAGFRSRHSEEARAQPGLCTTCHSENSCIQCHQESKVAPGPASRSPHPLGWISLTRGGDHGRAARIDPSSCAGCHGGAGEQLCVDCHRVGGSGGSPHGPGFRSTKDKSRDVPCRACHGLTP